jgi:hypothetical protein
MALNLLPVTTWPRTARELESRKLPLIFNMPKARVLQSVASEDSNLILMACVSKGSGTKLMVWQLTDATHVRCINMVHAPWVKTKWLHGNDDAPPCDRPWTNAWIVGPSIYCIRAMFDPFLYHGAKLYLYKHNTWMEQRSWDPYENVFCGHEGPHAWFVKYQNSAPNQCTVTSMTGETHVLTFTETRRHPYSCYLYKNEVVTRNDKGIPDLTLDPEMDEP